MISGRASRTAEYAAAFRAIETARRPAADRLFEDPFAMHFLSPELQRFVRWSRIPVVGALVRAYIDRRWPGAMTSGIARTRLLDDWLCEALGEGVGQVLLLGAGFDCRAYRMPRLSECRVFEIDHPDTQAAKKKRLLAVIGTLPGHVEFVAADLARQDLSEVLETAGIARGGRCVVVWEGVTHYIGGDAVDATLRALGSTLAPGSGVLFTYVHHALIDGTAPFLGARVSARKVAGDGEPWIWGMDPDQLPGYLAERNFELVEDVGADEYRTRYWGARGRRMRGFGFYRVARARRTAAGSGGRSE